MPTLSDRIDSRVCYVTSSFAGCQGKLNDDDIAANVERPDLIPVARHRSFQSPSEAK